MILEKIDKGGGGFAHICSNPDCRKEYFYETDYKYHKKTRILSKYFYSAFPQFRFKWCGKCEYNLHKNTVYPTIRQSIQKRFDKVIDFIKSERSYLKWYYEFKDNTREAPTWLKEELYNENIQNKIKFKKILLSKWKLK